jgi:hypothetical protein
MFFIPTAVLATWQVLAYCADPPPSLDSQPANFWIKRSPLPGGPPSPRLGYESSLGYDPRSRLLIRWGGHNQGGGGEQNAETWTFDLATAKWTLRHTNDAPPGVCCAQQNVFDIARGRFVRFPSFSGSHGWQWSREIALKNSSVWTYDPATNTWREMRPVPEPRVSPLRCASYDTDHDVIVVFGGEGNSEGTLVYDLYTNTWTSLKPPEQPAFRSGGNMAYDEARKLHVLFGAQFIDDPHTWAFDLAANRWTDLKPKTQPTTDRNDAVLTYDPTSRVIIAVVRVMDGKGEKAKSHLETWALDTGKRTWKKMSPPAEPPVSGNRARMMIFLPDRGVAVLEDRTHPPTGPAEQQIWTYRYAKAPAKPDKGPSGPRIARARKEPPLVEQIVASVLSEKQVELTWKAPANIVGYHVERAVVEVWSEDQLHREKKHTPPLKEPSVAALHRIGPFTTLTKEPVNATRWTDNVDLGVPQSVKGKPLLERRVSKEEFNATGKPYGRAAFAYRVRAVNALGVRGGPSPYVLTIPSAPQKVFSREKGTQCDLKWTANPEQKLRGYRVYRLDGRWSHHPVTRLTAEPIDRTTFTDSAAGKASRRYHVVAVDALGQEGIPSAPVWFEREWKNFYKPFEGEWHQ